MELSDEQVSMIWAYVERACACLRTGFQRIDLRMSARRCAADTHFVSSVALETWLRSMALPRYMLLRNWWYVALLRMGVDEGVSLSRRAAATGRYASILSRFVVRTTGKQWRTISVLPLQVVRRRAVDAWIADNPELFLHATTVCSSSSRQSGSVPSDGEAVSNHSPQAERR